jgi:N-acetylglucosamine malate deacetylase 1
MKLDILAVGVHPDDVELSCSGTLLKHIQLGYKVGLLDLTKGELGTRGSAEIRTEEATEAAQILGALVREQLDLEDGFFTQNEAHLRKIIKIIRKYCPEIVFANAIDDRHPDHGRAAKLVSDACFLSGLVKIETLDENNIPQASWRPKSLYHYIQDRALKPDFVVDITGYVDKKFELIMAYKSQFFDPLSIEPKTPISGKEFLDSIKGKDSVYGRYIGVQFAEGFNVEKTIGVQNVFDLM